MKVNQYEKKKAKFRISFVFLFIFASFAVCFTLYMKEDFEVTEDMFENISEAVVYVEPVGQNNYNVNPVPLSERQSEDYYNNSVFIGSKLLSGLSDYGYVKPENMLLSDSIKLNNFNNLILSENGSESSIVQAVERKNAAHIYIMVGLYDLDNLNSDTIFNELESFIDDINSKNKGIDIYLMSILPLSAESDGVIASNTDIDTYNSLLQKFADKMNVNYLDINTKFKGNDGKLPAFASEANGMRLKEETYSELSEYILTHVRN
ncbi:MAG: GDSL-type esterase/lipase family protein [Oscillospiraceae bacterium]